MTMTAGAPARPRPVFHDLRVAAVERLCPDAVAVTFDVPDGLRTQFEFRPGQSLTLRRMDGPVGGSVGGSVVGAVAGGADERRSYSICSPAGGPLRIGVREVPGGLFSSWLVHEVRPGDVVEVLPPAGAFCLPAFSPPATAPGHHVLLAAGSGITPVLSIAASALAGGSSVTVLYGNRSSGTVMFAEELADLKDRYPSRFALVHVLSREPRDVEVFSGRLDAARLRTLLSALVTPAAVDHWWLCGPHGMVTDATEVLRTLGVAGTRVHRELFFADEPAPAPVRVSSDLNGGSVTVVLDGRTTEVPLPSGATVLDAAQKVRADLPFACKGGVCGTCRARVTDGEVRMRRNFALDDEEVAAGYVLTCQAEAVTDSVTVDFDS